MNKLKTTIKAKIKSLENIHDLFYRRLQKCDLCPRNCKVNRLKGATGYCGIAKDMVIYTAFLHQGEEPPISGERGSATVFFSGCNLKCVYCQNYKFSNLVQGRIFKEEELAELMYALQEKGAHNINFVTPTHVLPQIINSLLLAFKKGVNIPLVYNTSGYEKKEIIEELSNIIDIYLTDIKYITSYLAEKYSSASNYPLFAMESALAMYNQVKRPVFCAGKLKKGLIVRHLALPGYSAETKAVVSWIKENIPEAFLSIMFQYQPYHKAESFPEINRRLNYREYQEIKNFIEKIELKGWMQHWPCQEEELAGVNFTSFSS
jgi:putative pyruvate formate lyase activating enzyme